MMMLGTMNAKITGSGNLTLVLSHGYGSSQYIWDDILPKLNQKYRVVVFDWSFSGAVDPPVVFNPSKNLSLEGFSDDLINLVDEMDLSGSVFVGHSMAGMIGCIASIKRRDLFSQLVLIGASPRYLNAEDYEGGFDIADVENILYDIQSDFKKWIKSFAPFVVGPNDPKSNEKFRRNLEKMNPDAALALAKIIFLGDLRDVLESVEVPCTIIQTANDAVVPVFVANYMQSKIRSPTSVEIIETDGHFPQLTAPQLLIEVIDRAVMVEQQQPQVN